MILYTVYSAVKGRVEEERVIERGRGGGWGELTGKGVRGKGRRCTV